MQLKKLIKIFFIGFIFLIIIFILINFYIIQSTKNYIYLNADNIPDSEAALVLGASVRSDGTLSSILEDRILRALELYNNKKVHVFLLSGDDRSSHYEEVNSMKNYLYKQGIPAEDILLDPAGINTFNSIFRSHNLFLINNVIIITQEYHLSRALFIARSFGQNAYGYAADLKTYDKIQLYKFREFFARIKAFFEVYFIPRT
jgi:SanA protein